MVTFSYLLLFQKIPSELQDSDLQNVSVHKLLELADKMPEYVDVASQTTFMTVTKNLMDITSHMVDSVNYVVYGKEQSNPFFATQGIIPRNKMNIAPLMFSLYKNILV